MTISFVYIAYPSRDIRCKLASETDEDFLGARPLGRSTSDRAEGRQGIAAVWPWRLGGSALCSDTETSQR